MLLGKLISGALGRAGFDVNIVSNGEEAWESIISDRYDLLLTDYEMPRLSGLELITRIREGGGTIPSVIMSGYTGLEMEHQNSKLQIGAVISKPFTSFHLVDTLREVLEIARCGPEGNPASGHSTPLT